MNESINNRLILLEYHLKIMNEYLETLKEFLTNLQQKGFQDYLKNKGSDFESIAFELKYSAIHDMNNLYFPQLHYSSFFLSTYSLIEAELKELCLICEDKFNFGKKDEINGKNWGREKSRLFLKNELGLILDRGKWEEVYSINILRNKIAHLGIDFDKKLLEYEEIKDFVEKHNLIKVYKFKYLIIDFVFCKHILDFVSTFFLELGKMISDKIEHSS